MPRKPPSIPIPEAAPTEEKVAESAPEAPPVEVQQTPEEAVPVPIVEPIAEAEPEIPAVYRCPANLESAAREIEVAREKVASIEAQISEAVAVLDHDLESRYRGQCRAARQALSSLELHKSRMES